MTFVVAREAVIRYLIPRRARRDEGVKLRPDTRVGVKRPEADSYFLALRPLGSEQARAADRTKGFHASIVRPENADQLLAGEQPEPLARDSSLSSAEGARMLSAPRAMAVISPAKRRRHLEANAAAEARAIERFVGARLSGHVRPTVSGGDVRACSCGPANQGSFRARVKRGGERALALQADGRGFAPKG
jgi:hypothetical protein